MPKTSQPRNFTDLGCTGYQSSIKKLYNIFNISTSKAHGVALVSRFLAFSQTAAYTVRPRIPAGASYGVPFYVSAFAGIYCAYPQKGD